MERLAEARGVALQRHGQDLLGRCPFYEDKTPSLVVTPSKNLWHCLGACGTGGSAIDWVMKAEGVSFRHAVELLRADLPSLASGASGSVVKVGTVRKLPAPVEGDVEDAALLRQVVDYYHATLKESPEALAYLASRGLESSEAVDHFKLGFANRTLGLRLPMKNRDAGAALRGRLQRLGVLRESGHEHFNGSLVVPVLDAEGNVTEMYGRKVTQNLRPGTPLHLYLPGPHRGVWNAAGLAGQRTVILCEALLDALTFWVAGFRNVTAAYGVEGFTADHLAALQKSGAERVLIAYDRDEAGDRAAAALAERLTAAGLECYRVQFPRGLDANAYALKVQPAPKSLAVALRQAVWMGKGPSRPLSAGEISPVSPPSISLASPVPTAGPGLSARHTLCRSRAQCGRAFRGWQRPVEGDNVRNVQTIQERHMSEISASEAREGFSAIINRAAFGKERVVLTRRGRKLAAVIPVEDLEALEALEDKLDVIAAARAEKRAKAKGEKPIPWKKAKKALGL